MPSCCPSSSSSSSILRLCRICHEEEEEEEERETAMEAPCACSGTLKFAHRECIQRWCDEKGNTVCEICLQKFEPGYSVPVKKALIEVGVTIRFLLLSSSMVFSSILKRSKVRNRESSEVPRRNYTAANERNGEAAEHAAGCSPTSERGATACRQIVATLTAILLVRHLFSVMTDETEEYAFSLLTVFVLRASGILLPFYVIMSAIKSIQYSQRRQLLLHRLHESNGGPRLRGSREDELLQHHVIQIQS